MLVFDVSFCFVFWLLRVTDLKMKNNYLACRNQMRPDNKQNNCFFTKMTKISFL